jgi:hypothetical protein
MQACGGFVFLGAWTPGLFFFTGISDTDLIGNNLIVLITTNRFIHICSLRKGKNPLHIQLSSLWCDGQKLQIE